MGYDKRRATGPLTDRQEEILVDLAGGKRQKEIAQEKGFSESYVSGELCLAALKMGVRTTAAAVARYRSYTVHLEVAGRLLKGRTSNTTDPTDLHVNHVLEQIAEDLKASARRLLPQ